MKTTLQKPQMSTELTNNTEAVTDTYVYDAWGSVISTTGNTPNPFKFTGNVGYYFDADTGNQYIRARIYSPIIARWLSTDPMGISNSNNLYVFSSNSPVSRTDPSGLISIFPVPGQKLGRIPCGQEAIARWGFKLDNKNTCLGGRGYLVQRVVVSCIVHRCEKGRCPTSEVKPISYTYYEAWPVEQNEFASSIQRGDETDKASTGIYISRCGFKSQVGEVRFYCESMQPNSDEGYTGRELRIFRHRTHGEEFGPECSQQVGGIWSFREGEIDFPDGNIVPFWRHRPRESSKFRVFAATWNCCPECVPLSGGLAIAYPN